MIGGIVWSGGGVVEWAGMVVVIRLDIIIIVVVVVVVRAFQGYRCPPLGPRLNTGAFAAHAHVHALPVATHPSLGHAPTFPLSYHPLQNITVITQLLKLTRKLESPET